MSGYKDVCLAKSSEDKTCKPPSSIPLMIAGSYEDKITQFKINTFMKGIEKSEESFARVKFFFDKEFSKSNTKVSMMRSLFSFGYPLKGFKNTQDEDKKQKEQF